MLLITLLFKYFYDNIVTVKYPNNVILVRKLDTLNIKKINVPRFVKSVKLSCDSIDLSKVESLSKNIIKTKFILI